MKKSDNEMKEEKEDKLFVYFSFIMIVIGGFGLIYSVSLFWIGFHNTDIAYNMAKLEATTGTEWVDRDSAGELLDRWEVYQRGTSQQQEAFYLGLGSTALLFTYILLFIGLAQKVAKQ